VRVKLRSGMRMRWFAGTAELLPQDDPRARQKWLTKQRPSTWMNSMVVRGMGTALLTVRIKLD
jgi:hypothetical protein